MNTVPIRGWFAMAVITSVVTARAAWCQQQTSPVASPVPSKTAPDRTASVARASSAKRAAEKLTDEQRALHGLNRLTFGPRPGDLQKVMNMDVDDWIEQQLHPEEINDGVLDAKLGQFRTLRMPVRELVQTFPNNNLVRGAAEGKIALPADAMKRAIYEVQISILAERQKEDQAARDGKTMDADTKAKIDKQNQDSVAAQADGILALTKEKRMEAIIALSPDELRLLVTTIRGPQR